MKTTTTRNPSTIMVFAATICMLFVTSMMLTGTVASTGKTFSQTEVYANVGATAINFIETQTAGSFSGAQMEVAKVGTAILLQTDLNITGQSYVNEDQRTIGDKSVQKAAMEMMQNQEAILSGTMMQRAVDQNDAMSQVMKWTAVYNIQSSIGAIMMPWTATTMKELNLVISPTYNLSAGITTSLATQATTTIMVVTGSQDLEISAELKRTSDYFAASTFTMAITTGYSGSYC
jgi:hypothetical protein